MALLNPLTDTELSDYLPFLEERRNRYREESARILRGHGSLKEYAGLHQQLGLRLVTDAGGSRRWCMCEYMPSAGRVWLTTNRINFELRPEYEFVRLGHDLWRLYLPEEALCHGDYYEIRLYGKGDTGLLRRVPAFARWVEQDKSNPDQWCARVWAPEKPYEFRNAAPARPKFPRIYEAHIGMAQDARTHTRGSIGSYDDFSSKVLPRIKAGGYNAVQLMGVPEHPLYKSFGYQVSSYFAPCSRYGDPEGFCRLVDEAHRLGLYVILDITHAHACANTEQGLAKYDSSAYFFDTRANQWGTPSFDYRKDMTRRFLLSNCRYWMEEFHVDGFRFDAVGNMLYTDHGIGDSFSHVGRCFYAPDGTHRTNAWGELYLCMANALVHGLNPAAVTIAEEFSGMPGLTCPPEQGGLGFDYRFAMGLPDFWGKYIKKPGDMGRLWYEMTNHRPYDRTISYVECHDQCINGDDAMIWRLVGDAMYTRMSPFNATWNETRGVSLYRLMRGITLTSADAGYLSFMGTEFGHPEWLDDEEHAHRQWQLAEDQVSFYAALARWDRALLKDIVDRHRRDFAKNPEFRFIHEDHRLLAFGRGRLLFAFNFHETRPEPELCFPVPPGKYVEILSSDEPRFGGCGNLVPGKPATEHFSDAATGIDMQNITLYLPPLTMLVLERK